MNEQKLTLAESNVYTHNQRQTDSSTSSQDSDESTGFSDDSDDDSIKQVQRNKALIQKHMATNRRRQKYIQNSFKSMGTQELAQYLSGPSKPTRIGLRAFALTQ